VTVDRDAVAGPKEEEEEEEETVRRSVWEERCRCLDDRIGMEENGLHRTDVVPAKRSTALRMKTAGWCMECSAEFRASQDSAKASRRRRGCDDPNSAGPDYGWTRGASACGQRLLNRANPNLLVPCPRKFLGMPSNTS
jgi:hypothetical protein